MTIADKTLLISEIFPPRIGGSGRWFWEIYRRFPAGKFVIAAGAHDGQDAFDATHQLHVLRMPLTFSSFGLISKTGIRDYAGAYRRLSTIVSKEKITNIHCGRCLPEGLLALALRHTHGIPYCCYVHGEDIGTAQTSRELRALARRVLHGAELVFVNSRNTEQVVRQFWDGPSDRICLFHPGVDTDQFVLADLNASKRQELGWNERPVVLTVARLQKRKGHDKMILAMSLIRKALPHALYAIAGEGEEQQELSALIQQLGLREHVQFLGRLNEEELVHCYQQCDLFVLPNRQVGEDFEGFGMVLLEAQACGKAVVAGASGGTCETMRIPETGRTVPCEDHQELAAEVLSLLSDDPQRRRMGHAARRWVVEHFSWDVLLRQAEELFERPRVSLSAVTAN